MIKRFLNIISFISLTIVILAQEELPKDTIIVSQHLDEVVATGVGKGNSINKIALLKTEDISQRGLQKMACCNVAESFENSSTISVGYSDAISGARQIRMMGLAGIYTQILDESRPIQNRLAQPYALTYTPGAWLAGISISKGLTSVISGHEAITGQINLEHRKPTDRERLYLNVYLDDELRTEVNMASAMPVVENKIFSQLLFHGSADSNVRHTDANNDGFRDVAETHTASIANKWLCMADNGMQIRWGYKILHDGRTGGENDFRYHYRDRKRYPNSKMYGAHIANSLVNGYVKIAIPVGSVILDTIGVNDRQSNIAVVADYEYYHSGQFAGLNQYDGIQHCGALSLLYTHYFNLRHTLTTTVQWHTADYHELLLNSLHIPGLPAAKWQNYDRRETEIGAAAEYTYQQNEKLQVVAGLRFDYNSLIKKALITPRFHLKYTPIHSTSLRLSAGLGHRVSQVLTDNIAMLATGRDLILPRYDDSDFNPLESAFNGGISVTHTIDLRRAGFMTISVDYFHTQFFNKVLLDQEYGNNPDNIHIYSTSHPCFSDAWQADITWTPVERLEIVASFRYNLSRVAQPQIDGGYKLIEPTLTSRYKGLINIQYATKFRRWIFDFTAQINGPARMPATSTRQSRMSPVYPNLFAQVTYRIKQWEIYIGCENITGYMQHDAIESPEAPFSTRFNSMNIYGPLMGRKFYAGFRLSIF